MQFKFSGLEKLLPESELAMRAMLVVNDMNSASWCNYRSFHARGLEPDIKASLRGWVIRMQILQLREAMKIVNRICDSPRLRKFYSSGEAKKVFDQIRDYINHGPKCTRFQSRVTDVRDGMAGHWSEKKVTEAIKLRASDAKRDITSAQLSLKPWFTHFSAGDDIMGTMVLRLAWGIPEPKDANDVYNTEVDEIADLTMNVMKFLFLFAVWYIQDNQLVTG